MRVIGTHVLYTTRSLAIYLPESSLNRIIAVAAGDE